eukprot:3068184-Rhodomonas_salina.1
MALTAGMRVLGLGESALLNVALPVAGLAGWLAHECAWDVAQWSWHLVTLHTSVHGTWRSGAGT